MTTPFDGADSAAVAGTPSDGARAGGTTAPPAPPEAVATTADELAALVLAVPGVTALHAGRFGEVATYLPGRRVTGVRLGEDRVEVHVVLQHGSPLRLVAQEIHAVVAAVVTLPVTVFVEDLAGPTAA